MERGTPLISPAARAKNLGLSDASAGVPGPSLLWFGNLSNGANAGLRYVNANNALGTTNWNYLPRLTTKKIVLLHHAAPETARGTGLGESLKLVGTAPGYGRVSGPHGGWDVRGG